MAESIKGLTVKIGADTSDFIKGLKKVDKEINTTTKQANELQKGLELEFNEDRFVEAQRLIQNALNDTQEKAKAIREQLKFLEDSGAIDTEGYKRLQTELYKTENQALLLQKRFDELGSSNKKSIGSMITNLKGFVSNLNPIVAAATALGAATVKMVKDTTKQADEIATLATKYNQSTEAIQRWNYIAMQSDVDSNVLYKSMQKLNSAFGEQAQGQINASTQALADLGINIQNFDNYDDAFTATIQRISSLEDATQQLYYANQIFGEQVGTNLIPLFKQGSEAISSYNEEFEASGAMTDDQIQDLAKFDNMMNEVNTKFKNTAYQLGSSLMPILRSLFSFLDKSILPLISSVLQILQPLIDALAWIIDAVTKINNFFMDIGLKLIGKGWLWGREDSSKSTNTTSNFNETLNNYSIPNNTNNSNVYNEDNSTYNFDLTVNSSGNLEYDAKDLANEVMKQIALKQQVGR